MNRSDWVFVGVRLYGLYLLVSAALSLPTLLQFGVVSLDGVGMPPVHFFMSALVPLVANFLLGAALFLGAPRIARWLGVKDARLMADRPAG